MCSPDLNPLDYFLCGYLKDKIFTEGPTDLIKIHKSHIMQYIEQIDRNMLKKVFANLLKLACICLAVNGQYLQGVLQKFCIAAKINKWTSNQKNSILQVITYFLPLVPHLVRHFSYQSEFVDAYSIPHWVLLFDGILLCDLSLYSFLLP